jgi:hypothetical protein
MTRNAAERRCLHCDQPLPAGSRRTRVFCSTSCRVRHWDALNRPYAADDRLSRLYGSSNPKHYHLRADGVRFLVGHRDNEPCFGTACPPECPGLLEGQTFEPMEPYWRSNVGRTHVGITGGQATTSGEYSSSRHVLLPPSARSAR